MRVYLPIIFHLRGKLGYCNSLNIFILSDNLASALEEPAIIDKTLFKYLTMGQDLKFENLTFVFFNFPLGFEQKHNGKWRRIYNFSHPWGKSANNHISNKAKELKYICFQEFSKLVIQEMRKWVILKINRKNSLWNFLIALLH